MKYKTDVPGRSLRERPDYRVSADASGCSLPELLAAMIGGSDQIHTAERLLERYKGDVHQIYYAHVQELAAVPGIGLQTAARIKSAFALGLRLHVPADEKPTINSPADAAELVKYEMSLLQQESLRVLLLDKANHLLEIVEIYRGSVDTAQVRVGEIFKPAVQRSAPSLIVAHNHPSAANGGSLMASPDDIAVTRAIVQGGKLLDILVMDHLIVGGGNYLSLKSQGLGFN
jgi:DNA repair protein RadC